MSRTTVAVLVLLVLLGCATAHARQEPLGGAIEAREGRALTWLWGGHWLGHRFWWRSGVRWYDDDWCSRRRMKCWDEDDNECDCGDRRRVKRRRWRC